MEHLMSAKERGERRAEIRDIPTIPWLGFDHDERYHDNYPGVSDRSAVK